MARQAGMRLKSESKGPETPLTVEDLPVNGDRMRAALVPQRGSSPAHACVEMADG